METKTIEERATLLMANIKICAITEIHAALAEQDGIARKEQREIDIQRAVEYTCNGCCFVKRCKLKPNGKECLNIKLLRQAMKGE